MRRVVITGMGAITPVGLSVEEFWNSVKEGKTNSAEVTRFDSTNYRAHMAAEINNFNPKDYMDFKSAKRMELFSQYAVAAAKEAIEQSGLDMTKEDPFRVGCSVGSGIGSKNNIGQINFFVKQQFMKKHAAYKIQNTNYRTEKHQEKTDKNKHFSFFSPPGCQHSPNQICGGSGCIKKQHRT